MASRKNMTAVNNHVMWLKVATCMQLVDLQIRVTFRSNILLSLHHNVTTQPSPARLCAMIDAYTRILIKHSFTVYCTLAVGDSACRARGPRAFLWQLNRDPRTALLMHVQ